MTYFKCNQCAAGSCYYISKTTHINGENQCPHKGDIITKVFNVKPKWIIIKKLPKNLIKEIIKDM